MNGTAIMQVIAAIFIATSVVVAKSEAMLNEEVYNSEDEIVIKID